MGRFQSKRDLVPADPTPIKGQEQDVGPASTSPASSQNTVPKSSAPSSDAQVSDTVQGMNTEGAVPKEEPKEEDEEEEGMEVDSGAGGDGGVGMGGGTEEDLLEWKDGIATLPGSSMKVRYFNRFIVFISFS